MSVVCAFAVPVVAQDGLYAPQVPEDAALVRVVNLDFSAASPRIDTGSVRFEPLAPGLAGPYRPVDPGIYLIGRRGAQVEFVPTPAAFHTIVTLPNGEIRVFQDQAHRDPARTQIVLYNLSATTAELASLEPAAALVQSLGPGASRAIVINAIPIELSARRGGAEVLRQAIRLDRGASYAVFVGAGDAVLHMAQVSGS